MLEDLILEQTMKAGPRLNLKGRVKKTRNLDSSLGDFPFEAKWLSQYFFCLGEEGEGESRSTRRRKKEVGFSNPSIL